MIIYQCQFQKWQPWVFPWIIIGGLTTLIFVLLLDSAIVDRSLKDIKKQWKRLLFFGSIESVFMVVLYAFLPIRTGFQAGVVLAGHWAIAVAIYFILELKTTIKDRVRGIPPKSDEILNSPICFMGWALLNALVIFLWFGWSFTTESRRIQDVLVELGSKMQEKSVVVVPSKPVLYENGSPFFPEEVQDKRLWKIETGIPSGFEYVLILDSPETAELLERFQSKRGLRAIWNGSPEILCREELLALQGFEVREYEDYMKDTKKYVIAKRVLIP